MFDFEQRSHTKTLSKNLGPYQQVKPSLKSRMFLFLSIIFLFGAFLLIFSDKVGIISSDKKIGDLSDPVLWALFYFGLLINFFIVPFLYISSYNKFKRDDDFWDMEIFWILPLSFFGIFFQFTSNMPFINITIVLSFIVILMVHVPLMIISRRLISYDEQFESTSRYFMSFAYLSAYYVLLIISVLFFDLFNKLNYMIN